MKKILAVVVLVAVAVIERVLIDMGPNVELVTTAMLLTSAYLGRSWGMMVVFMTMGLSDVILGNTNIVVFTWSGFFIEALIAGKLLDKDKSKRGAGRVLQATFIGVGASVWFYLWTNFGVWLLDSWGMYSNDLQGLMASYINGLPFLKMNLKSTLVLVPLGFFIAEGLRYLVANKKEIGNWISRFIYTYE